MSDGPALDTVEDEKVSALGRSPLPAQRLGGIRNGPSKTGKRVVWQNAGDVRPPPGQVVSAPNSGPYPKQVNVPFPNGGDFSQDVRHDTWPGHLGATPHPQHVTAPPVEGQLLKVMHRPHDVGHDAWAVRPGATPYPQQVTASGPCGRQDLQVPQRPGDVGHDAWPAPPDATPLERPASVPLGGLSSHHPSVGSNLYGSVAGRSSTGSENSCASSASFQSSDTADTDTIARLSTHSLSFSGVGDRLMKMASKEKFRKLTIRGCSVFAILSVLVVAIFGITFMIVNREPKETFVEPLVGADFDIIVTIKNKRSALGQYCGEPASWIVNLLVQDRTFIRRVANEFVRVLPKRMSASGIKLAVQRKSLSGLTVRLAAKVEEYDLAEAIISTVGREFADSVAHLEKIMTVLLVPEKYEAARATFQKQVKRTMMKKLPELTAKKLADLGIESEIRTDPPPPSGTRIHARKLTMDLFLHVVIRNRTAMTSSMGGLMSFIVQKMPLRQLMHRIMVRLEADLPVKISNQLQQTLTVKVHAKPEVDIGNPSERCSFWLEVNINDFQLADILRVKKGPAVAGNYTRLLSIFNEMNLAGVKQAQDLSEQFQRVIKEKIVTQMRKTIALKLEKQTGAEVESVEMEEYQELSRITGMGRCCATNHKMWWVPDNVLRTPVSRFRKRTLESVCPWVDEQERCAADAGKRGSKRLPLSLYRPPTDCIDKREVDDAYQVCAVQLVSCGLGVAKRQPSDRPVHKNEPVSDSDDAYTDFNGDEFQSLGLLEV